MRPKYITLYDSYAIGSCVKSWPDLMAKQNWYTKHFHKNTITRSYTPSKTKIPITIVKVQMPSNPNQKSCMRDNEVNPLLDCFIVPVWWWYGCQWGRKHWLQSLVVWLADLYVDWGTPHMQCIMGSCDWWELPPLSNAPDSLLHIPNSR